MADGNDNNDHEEPTTVRRQIDVPAHLDEDAVQFLDCNSDLIMSLAEQITYDDKKGACNVCFLSQARLIPVKDEIKSAWLSNLPQPTAVFFGDEEDEEESDAEEEEDEEGTSEDVEIDEEDEEADTEESEKPEPEK